MKLLVKDVETTGKLDFSKPADAEGQPRLIQVSWSLIDTDTRAAINVGMHYIKPDGWRMDDELAAQLGHHMTHEFLEANGVPIAEALPTFLVDHDASDLLCGYSASYDLKILRGECRRLGIDDRYATKPVLDVMYACAPAVKAHPAYGGKKKLPKLTEAHSILIGEEFTGAHDATNDRAATERLYWWLFDNGHPLVPKQHTATSAKEEINA